jgi:hypothetical protein
MRVSEEPVCIYLFRQNPVFTSLHLRSPEEVQQERETSNAGREKLDFSERGKQKPVLLRLSLAVNLEKTTYVKLCPFMGPNRGSVAMDSGIWFWFEISQNRFSMHRRPRSVRFGLVWLGLVPITADITCWLSSTTSCSYWEFQPSNCRCHQPFLWAL